MFINICYSVAKLIKKKDSIEKILARMQKISSVESLDLELHQKELDGIGKVILRLKNISEHHKNIEEDFFSYLKHSNDGFLGSSFSKYLIRAFIMLSPNYSFLMVMGRVESSILRLKILEVMNSQVV
jgi:hypothetical protein